MNGPLYLRDHLFVSGGKLSGIGIILLKSMADFSPEIALRISSSLFFDLQSNLRMFVMLFGIIVIIGFIQK